MMSNERSEDAAAREKRAEELLKSVERVLSGEPERAHNIRDTINEETANGVDQFRKIPLKKRPSSE